MRWVALGFLIGCSGKPNDDKPSAPTPAPTDAPMPIDERMACKTDGECQVFTECCAHCSPTRTTISLNKAYEKLGVLLTQTFTCVDCSTVCKTPEPKSAAACIKGECARRDTTVDGGGVANTVEQRNPPWMIERLDKAEVQSLLMQHACRRAKSACGATVECDVLAVPWTSSCSNLKDCYGEIDQMPCSTDFVTFVEDAVKLSACAGAQQVCTHEAQSRK